MSLSVRFTPEFVQYSQLKQHKVQLLEATWNEIIQYYLYQMSNVFFLVCVLGKEYSVNSALGKI